MRRVTDQIDMEYQRIKDSPDQKAFADEARKNSNSSALFALRERKFRDAYSWLRSLSKARRLQALQAVGEFMPQN